MLIHVNNANVHSPESNASTFSDRDDVSQGSRSNPFDQLKNACQNLFTTFSEKIATDLNIDLRSSPSSGSTQPNVFSSQPSYRRSSRPSDASFNSCNNRNQSEARRPHHFEPGQRFAQSGTPQSPSSPGSVRTPPAESAAQQPSANTQPKRLPNERVKRAKQLDDGSGCECSDDEVITKFRREYSSKSNDTSSPTSETAAQAFSTSSATRTGESSTSQTKRDAGAADSSDASSFEDLGAVGCSSAATEVDNNWQIVDKPAPPPPPASQTNEPSTSMTESNTSQRQTESSGLGRADSPNTSLQRNDIFRDSERKLFRRRSDGVVYTSSSNPAGHLYNENIEGAETPKQGGAPLQLQRTPCHRCGKTKGNIRKYAARLRKQLETRTNSSESEIREQVEAFLRFLESEGRASSELKNDSSVSIESPTMPESELASTSPRAHGNEANFSDIRIEDYDEFDIDENVGIHVYGSDEASPGVPSPRQFFNLDHIDSK